MNLKHRPFQALRGKQFAQVIRLPLPDRHDEQDDEDSPTRGAQGVLIALAFGASRRSKKAPRMPRLTGWSAKEIEAVRLEDERRGVRR